MEDNFVIEALHYGNYKSCIEISGFNPEYITMMKEFRQLEENLTNKMSESDQHDFEIMMDKRFDAENILNATSFLCGFRIATRLLTAAL